jgi:cysteine desulfurase
VPGNINLSFPPVEGEAMVLQLDLRHIAVSSGSACNSREIRPSKVILALGKTEAIARSTVRFSMGRETTEDSIQWVVQTLKTLVPRMTRATAGVPDAVISA